VKARYAAASAAVLLLAACGAELSFDAESAGGGPDSGFAPDRTADASPGSDSEGATGLVVVHAASFPSLRLCFENLPHLRPQPDVNAMPQANVVGLEVGSLVRLDPLTVPGKVYVIDQRRARVTVGSDQEATCGERICTDGNTCLLPDVDYLAAGEITEPLGTGGVDLLAITGCGSQPFLAPGEDSARCGDAWSPTRGNLLPHVFRLSAGSAASEGALPVQLFHLARALEHDREGAPLEVRFGDLSSAGPLAQAVPVPALHAASPDVSLLTIDQSDAGVYATHGFRMTVGADAGGAGTVAFEQTLANVQELSAPRELPTHYFRGGSTYALLLVGDPDISRTLGDGGPNPSYDERRALHFLAVPVREPAEAGAGADGGEAPDGSSSE
jgi:hypothetical protein